MSNFVKFIAKYADEALAIGDALATLMDGVALSPSDASKVHAVIDRLQAASASILGSIADGEETPIVIRQEDIDRAVAKYLAAKDAEKADEV